MIEPAARRRRPSWPRKYRTLAVALAAGMMLGAGLALLRDRMDGRMRSVEEIQTIIGLPVLGVVPQMSGRRTAVARAMTVHLDPRSVVAEAYRTIRTAVYFGAGENRCKTILVTSPEPGDGKTTSASNLAIAIAQTGRSVLLLDADFRKPTQHKNLDIKDAVGLSSVLAGREPRLAPIQHTGVEGLDILPVRPDPRQPQRDPQQPRVRRAGRQPRREVRPHPVRLAAGERGDRRADPRRGVRRDDPGACGPTRARARAASTRATRC